MHEANQTVLSGYMWVVSIWKFMTILSVETFSNKNILSNKNIY